MHLTNRITVPIAATLVATLAGVSLFVAAFSAQAAVTPSISIVVHDGSHGTLSSALIGTPVHANVLVASTTASTSPTGTVDFSIYTTPNCTGAVTMQTGISLVNGIAESGTTTVSASGLSFRAKYNGQSDLYTPADSSCVSVAPTQFQPTLGIGLSTSTIPTGSSVFGSTTLSNASSSAGGSVEYRVYSNSSCTNLIQMAGTKTVVNGKVPNSDTVSFATSGTYYFQGVYSGDSTNAGATSSCGAVLTVTPTTTPGTGSGSISGIVFNDLDRDRTKDTNETGLSGWTILLHQVDTNKDPQKTKVWKHPFWKRGYKAPVVATTTTDGSGAYSFGNLKPGVYYVEEIVQDGWKQISGDVRVRLASSSDPVRINFSNIEKKVKQHDDEKDDDRKEKKNKLKDWWKKKSNDD